MEFGSQLKGFFLGASPDFREMGRYQVTDPRDPAYWLQRAFQGEPLKSGVSLSTLDSMRSTSVLACVRIISETAASLPLVIFQNRPEGGKEKAVKHPLYAILHYRANPLVTSFEWRELVLQHLLLWGNHYSEIERDNANRPLNLWPLRPDKMRVVAAEDGATLRYFYTIPEGREIELPQSNVLHIKGLSSNGYVGVSMIGLAREAVGLGLAMEEFTSRFFANDATPKSYISYPGKLSEPAFKNLQDSIEKRQRGLENKWRMQILEMGMKIESIGVPLEDAQFLELRKYERDAIYEMFRVPPHLGGVLDRATFSNMEEQGINFVVHTMRPWFVRIEQALQLRLFSPADLGTFYPMFIVDALLRGNTTTRYAAYKEGWMSGWLNADEIREKEDLNPLPNGKGKIYYVPANMVPAGTPAPEPKPANRDKMNGNGHTETFEEVLENEH